MASAPTTTAARELARCGVCLGTLEDPGQAMHGTCREWLFGSQDDVRVWASPGGATRLALTHSSQGVGLVPVASGGQFVLAPSKADEPDLAAMEHLALRMAGAVGVEIVPCARIRLRDGRGALLRQRVDGRPTQERCAAADFGQLAGLLSAPGQGTEAQALGAILEEYSDEPAGDGAELLRLFLLTTWVGCHDPRLRDLCLVEGSSCRLAPIFHLSPAWAEQQGPPGDLISSAQDTERWLARARALGLPAPVLSRTAHDLAVRGPELMRLAAQAQLEPRIEQVLAERLTSGRAWLQGLAVHGAQDGGRESAEQDARERQRTAAMSVDGIGSEADADSPAAAVALELREERARVRRGPGDPHASRVLVVRDGLRLAIQCVQLASLDEAAEALAAAVALLRKDDLPGQVSLHLDRACPGEFHANDLPAAIAAAECDLACHLETLRPLAEELPPRSSSRHQGLDVESIVVRRTAWLATPRIGPAGTNRPGDGASPEQVWTPWEQQLEIENPSPSPQA